MWLDNTATRTIKNSSKFEPAMDPAHPFPFIANQGRALVMKLKKKNKKMILNSIIVIPNTLTKFNDIKRGKNFIKYVIITNVIIFFTTEIFPHNKVETQMLYNINRENVIKIYN